MTRFGSGLLVVITTLPGGCFNPGSDSTETDASSGAEGSTGSAGTTAGPSDSTTDPTESTSSSTTDSSASSEGTTEGTSTEGGCRPGTESCACDEGACVSPLVCFREICADLGPLTPLPPDASTFMWQNVQTDFEYESGDACTGEITLAVGDQAACYVGSDNELKCAGRVFDTVWGDIFVGTGEMDVHQVFIRPTFNAANGNGICILAGQEIRCFGRNNNFGVYGDGTTNDVPGFTDWGDFSNIVRMATGTWDQICGLTDTGDVYCSGYDFGTSPVPVQSGAQSFWIDTFGAVNVDDDAVWRAQQGRTECRIGATGLACSAGVYGSVGELVDGGESQGAGIDPAHCWLTTGKEVQCSGASQTTYFESGRVLAFGYHYYTDSMCAVLDDASLWCWGSNENGKLGTGDAVDLLVETEVAPPGSVRIACE